jgi:putative ABC transport system permease protein
MDKKMALVDLADAQDSFYMQDMVTEWLGYLPRYVRYAHYQNIRDQIRLQLPKFMANPPADWALDDEPIVLSFLDQRNMANLAQTFELVRNIILGIFLFLMVLVLWNAGLQNGIHRYGEMGLRLALGETHASLVFWLSIEALAICILGSLAGCLIGGAVVYYLQEIGVNMGDAFAQTGLMLSDVTRARVTVDSFIYGVIPGISASLLGSLISSGSIFKRSEADLFRELEAG